MQVLSAASKQDQVAVACRLSEEPSDLLRDSLQHSIRGWEDLRAAPPEGGGAGRGLRCAGPARASAVLVLGALPMSSSLSGLDFASLPPLDFSLLASLGVD